MAGQNPQAAFSMYCARHQRSSKQVASRRLASGNPKVSCVVVERGRVGPPDLRETHHAQRSPTWHAARPTSKQRSIAALSLAFRPSSPESISFRSPGRSSVMASLSPECACSTGVGKLVAETMGAASTPRDGCNSKLSMWRYPTWRDDMSFGASHKPMEGIPALEAHSPHRQRIHGTLVSHMAAMHRLLEHSTMGRGFSSDSPCLPSAIRAGVAWVKASVEGVGPSGSPPKQCFHNRNLRTPWSPGRVADGAGLLQNKCPPMRERILPQPFVRPSL